MSHLHITETQYITSSCLHVAKEQLVRELNATTTRRPHYMPGGYQSDEGHSIKVSKPDGYLFEEGISAQVSTALLAANRIFDRRFNRPCYNDISTYYMHIHRQL